MMSLRLISGNVVDSLVLKCSVDAFQILFREGINNIEMISILQSRLKHFGIGVDERRKLEIQLEIDRRT